MSGAMNHIANSFSPDGEFVPAALFLPQLRANFAEDRELRRKGIEEITASRKEATKARKVETQKTQFAMAEDARQSEDPDRMVAFGRQVGAEAATETIESGGTDEQAKMAYRRARFALGLGRSQIDETEQQAGDSEAGLVRAGVDPSLTAGLGLSQRQTLQGNVAAGQAQVEQTADLEQRKANIDVSTARRKMDAELSFKRANMLTADSAVQAVNAILQNPTVQQNPAAIATGVGVLELAKAGATPETIVAAVDNFLGGLKSGRTVQDQNVVSVTTKAQAEQRLRDGAMVLNQLDEADRLTTPAMLQALDALEQGIGNVAEQLNPEQIDQVNANREIVESHLGLGLQFFIRKFAGSGAEVPPHEMAVFQALWPSLRGQGRTRYRAKMDVVKAMMVRENKISELIAGGSMTVGESLAAYETLKDDLRAGLEREESRNLFTPDDRGGIDALMEQ